MSDLTSYVPPMLEKETGIAYEWFVRYVTLGDRSLPQILAVYNDSPRLPSLRTVYLWAKKYKWRERAAQYDKDIATETQLIATEDLKHIREVVRELMLSKSEVLEDELEDYKKLLLEWRSRDLSVLDEKGFHVMIKARVELSNIAYRLSGLNEMVGSSNVNPTPQQNVIVNVYGGKQPQILEGEYNEEND